MMRPPKERIFLFSLLLFVFFIPIQQDISMRLLIVPILLSLFLLRDLRWRQKLLVNAWDVIVFFLVLAIGLLYSNDKIVGWSVLEKYLSFLLIPLIFSRMGFLQKREINTIFVVFTAGVAVSSAVCLGHAVWRDVFEGFPNGYYYDEFTGIIDSHPTYMAYYICFSVIFLLYLISYEKTSKSQQTAIILTILFLVSILMLTAGRSTFVSLLMMSSFFFLKLLFEQSPLTRKLQGISLTILVLAIILVQSPYTRKFVPNFLEGRPVKLSVVKGDSWERLVLWEAALKASTNLFMGVGTGDDTSVMNEYYRTNQMTDFAEVNFNAHNQFIQILFSNGLIGLAALLLILFRPIVLSMGRQNIFGMLTFFPFLIYGISEVFLGRYQGIIFFILLHQIFVTYFNQTQQKFSGIQTS